MLVLKTDISSFYETIDREQVLNKVFTDSLLSYQSINILRELFYNTNVSNFSGLPRGIGISATLSELYIRNFDKKVRQIEGVYFYTRYVDDMLIFAYKGIEQIEEQINKLLPKGL